MTDTKTDDDITMSVRMRKGDEDLEVIGIMIKNY